MNYGSASLLDPGPSRSLASAVDWIEAVALGPVATSVAVLAVAGIGFMLMTGRVDVRRAGTVILGCFLIFGARAIASGLAGLANAGDAPERIVQSPPPPPIIIPPSMNPPVNSYDPYAGASVPVRR